MSSFCFVSKVLSNKMTLYQGCQRFWLQKKEQRHETCDFSSANEFLSKTHHGKTNEEKYVEKYVIYLYNVQRVIQ